MSEFPYCPATIVLVGCVYCNVQKIYMSWIPSALVMGMNSLFGSSNGNSMRAQTALEDIREAMLDGLGAASSGESSKLELRVTYANDLHDLWYLRGDVMAAISAIDGEARALQKLSAISEMFTGVLPKALTSRPRRVGS